MTSTPDLPLPADMDATDRPADPKPERSLSGAHSPEGNHPPAGSRPDLSARDLQENRSQGEPLQAPPGSDADQANEVPHVG